MKYACTSTRVRLHSESTTTRTDVQRQKIMTTITAKCMLYSMGRARMSQLAQSSGAKDMREAIDKLQKDVGQLVENWHRWVTEDLLGADGAFAVIRETVMAVENQAILDGIAQRRKLVQTGI